MQIHKGYKNSLNFRDLGGLITNDNKIVKSGYFYRGASLGFFDDKELEHFKSMGIKTIMDLRSSYEMIRFPDPDISDIKWVEHSGLKVEGFEDIDWSPAGMRKVGGEAYTQLNRIESYYKALPFENNVFKLMVNKIVEDELPMYIHCAVGKDRTGMAAMIIEMILNVKEEEIKKDYLLSNLYREKIINESLNEVKEDIAEHPELSILISIQDGVVERTYDTIINSIKDKYYTFDNYLEKQFGLDENKLKIIRYLYTE